MGVGAPLHLVTVPQQVVVLGPVWPAGNDWSKEIYRRYFHVSSDFHSIGMSPRINGNGQPERLRVSDHG